MKKTILRLVALLAFTISNAQNEGGFKIGANAGAPMGKIGNRLYKDLYSVALGADVAYLLPISEKFVGGFGTGYFNFLGKTVSVGSRTVEIPDTMCIPVYGTAQYSIFDHLFVGADVGFAIGLEPSANEGGFLYQPKVGFQTKKLEIFVGYRGISAQGENVYSLNLGFFYKL